MYGFIHHINKEEELEKQIVEQTKLGFLGYYLKKMFRNGMTYYKGQNIEEKKALQIITPQQSLFALVRDRYDEVCRTLLNAMYKDGLDNNLRLTGNANDVISCVNLGNIYITEKDNDISLGDENLLSRLFKKKERQFNIYIPPFINNWRTLKIKVLKK